MHYTLKHGDWLNIAKTELSLLSAQCLGNKQIDSLDELNFTIGQWEKIVAKNKLVSTGNSLQRISE